MEISNEVKVDVYKKWKAGQSKASLAVQYDVSPRSIGRWIDVVEESGLAEEKPVIVEISEQPQAPADVRYLEAYGLWTSDVEYTKAGLADLYGVSPRTLGRWLERAEKEIQESYEYDDDELDCDVKIEKSLKHSSPIQFVDFNNAIIDEKPYTSTDGIHWTQVTNTLEYKCLATSKSISITEMTNGKVTGSQAIDRSNEIFENALDKLLETNFDQKTIEEVFLLIQPAKLLNRFTHGKLTVDVARNEIIFSPDDDTVPYLVDNRLSKRVVDAVRNGEAGVTTLLNFMDKLMLNPSRRAVNELYGFLEANDIEIGEDGDFYAWKRVAEDYLDIYTSTIDNSPGKSPRVSRNLVDEDSNNTCSHGLHVCSKSYLPSYSGARVIKVKVNPADVVAVPADYKNAKMRCCGYYVVEDVTRSNVWR